MGYLRRRTGVATTSKLHRIGKLAWTGVESAVVRRLPFTHRSTADEVAETLGELKGLAMKMGQQASYMQPQVSDEWRQALARLLQDAPPMSLGAAAHVVEEELGAPPSEVFAEWAAEPFGAASVGQVHRAVTHDGTVVAVKVQYPWAADALAADMDTVSIGIRTAARRGRTPAGERPGREDRLGMAAAMDDFKARIVQETDYLREADNQEAFREAFAGHPRIHVPAVVREHSSARVLTTELAEGARFEEVLEWDQEERDRAGETIFRFHHETFFLVGRHNADPHPGNYVFRPGGSVSFLDFGAVWDVPPDFHERVPRLLELGAEADRVPHGLRWFHDQVVALGPRALEMPKLPRRPEASAEEAFLRETAKSVAHSAGTFRGVQAVLATLGAVCDWGAIAREILARMPSRCASEDATGTL